MQSPQWTFPSTPFDPFSGRTIELPQVDEDIGHTLVHYLYTGTYQTLKSQGVSCPLTEYRRGILVYCVARLYELNGLADHAIRIIGLFDKMLSIFQVLDIASNVYPKLLEDETWLPDYLKTKIGAAFKADETIFSQERFLNHIGEATAFTKALVKIMVGIYTEKITSKAKKEGDRSKIREGLFRNPAHHEALVAASEDPVEECSPPPPPRSCHPQEPVETYPPPQEEPSQDLAAPSGANEPDWDSWRPSKKMKKGKKCRLPRWDENDMQKQVDEEEETAGGLKDDWGTAGGDDEWGTFKFSKKGKKAQKKAQQDEDDEQKKEDEEEETAREVKDDGGTASGDDEWGTFKFSKKGKKAKMKAQQDNVWADTSRPDESDEWACSATANKKEKRKKAKGFSIEEVDNLLPDANDKTEDTWDGGSSAVNNKKKSSRADLIGEGEENDKPVLDPLAAVQEEEEDGWGSFSPAKAKKKQSKATIMQLRKEREERERKDTGERERKEQQEREEKDKPERERIEEERLEQKKLNQEKHEKTLEEAAKESIACEEPGSRDIVLVVPVLEPDVEQSAVCPFRAQHILDGDSWKNCKKCRAVIFQLSIQLAHEGNLRWHNSGEI
jgi:hypothetical protein